MWTYSTPLVMRQISTRAAAVWWPLALLAAVTQAFTPYRLRELEYHTTVGVHERRKNAFCLLGQAMAIGLCESLSAAAAIGSTRGMLVGTAVARTIATFMYCVPMLVVIRILLSKGPDKPGDIKFEHWSGYYYKLNGDTYFTAMNSFTLRDKTVAGLSLLAPFMAGTVTELAYMKAAQPRTSFYEHFQRLSAMRGHGVHPFLIGPSFAMRASRVLFTLGIFVGTEKALRAVFLPPAPPPWKKGVPPSS